MEQLISNQFHQSIEAKIDHVEILSQPLQDAATLMTNCLLQEGKLLVCADGPSDALASTLAHCMLVGQGLERPGLPTMILSRALHDIGDANDPFSGQISALAKQQDLLIVISPGPVSQQLLSAATTARQHELNIVALTAPGHEALLAQLGATDVELFVNNRNQYRVQEIQLLIIFCLCELIENKLFGEVN
jgi:D-sedoheptulose 7-phosphate isomerase